jgi:hypothetical protein
LRLRNNKLLLQTDTKNTGWQVVNLSDYRFDRLLLLVVFGEVVALPVERFVVFLDPAAVSLLVELGELVGVPLELLGELYASLDPPPLWLLLFVALGVRADGAIEPALLSPLLSRLCAFLSLRRRAVVEAEELVQKIIRKAKKMQALQNK